MRASSDDFLMSYKPNKNWPLFEICLCETQVCRFARECAWPSTSHAESESRPALCVCALCSAFLACVFLSLHSAARWWPPRTGRQRSAGRRLHLRGCGVTIASARRSACLSMSRSALHCDQHCTLTAALHCATRTATRQPSTQTVTQGDCAAQRSGRRAATCPSVSPLPAACDSRRAVERASQNMDSMVRAHARTQAD